MFTGLKFGFGQTIQTANINIQAVPQEQEEFVLANSITTVTPLPGAGIEKTLVGNEPVQEPLGFADQQRLVNNFVNNFVALPDMVSFNT